MNIPPNISEYKQSRLLRGEKKEIEHKKAELISAIAAAKSELDEVSVNINFVSDPLLIDHYTYRLKAAEVRYRYLMCQARELSSKNFCCGSKIAD